MGQEGAVTCWPLSLQELAALRFWELCVTVASAVLSNSLIGYNWPFHLVTPHYVLTTVVRRSITRIPSPKQVLSDWRSAHKRICHSGLVYSDVEHRTHKASQGTTASAATPKKSHVRVAQGLLSLCI